MHEIEQDHDAAPFNPVPPVVVFLALAIFGVELIFQMGARGYVGGQDAIGWRNEAIREYGFFGLVFDWMVQTGRWPFTELLRFVTYPFVHIGFTHMIMAAVFLLALGKLVGEVFGNFAVILVFFTSSVAGALAYTLFLDDQMPLLGAFPGVYGYIGSYTLLMFISAGQTGDSRLGAFRLIGVLLGIQLVFGLLFGSSNDWVAEVAGFVTGFALTALLVPGMVAQLIRRLRQR